MKTQNILLFVSFIIVLTFSLSNPVFAQNSTDKFVVVLDAGHGGKDPGNLGNGYKEKDIALKIVLALGKTLSKHADIEVVYTRTTDVFIELIDRPKIANKADADLFVSVHCDSHTSQAYGAGTFVMADLAQKEEGTNDSEPGKDGITFKVQIAASSKLLETKPYNFKGLSAISKEKSGSLYKYFYGSTPDYEAAKTLEKEARSKGYKSSFIVAFKDGKQMALLDALKSR